MHILTSKKREEGEICLILALSDLKTPLSQKSKQGSKQPASKKIKQIWNESLISFFFSSPTYFISTSVDIFYNSIEIHSNYIVQACMTSLMERSPAQPTVCTNIFESSQIFFVLLWLTWIWFDLNKAYFQKKSLPHVNLYLIFQTRFFKNQVQINFDVWCLPYFSNKHIQVTLFNTTSY